MSSFLKKSRAISKSSVSKSVRKQTMPKQAVPKQLGDTLDPRQCSAARLSRDARFDGQFFTAVKTTGIYCRSICPATTPKEQNVHYFATAIAAASAGYRPCLRCRPDSAPGSPAWAGVSSTLHRAIKLIEAGALQEGSISDLVERLGISERYLRRLFQQHLGVSPKKFALYQQCLFAKKLLHQTRLPMQEIAFASGFNSVRRFNDCFQQQLCLTPSQVRQQGRKPDSAVMVNRCLTLKLSYRPPYNWPAMQQFLARRYITGLEWVEQHSYGRTFTWQGAKGWFTARHIADQQRFDVEISLDDLSKLSAVVQNIRRILDLDVDIAMVTNVLQKNVGAMPLVEGLRLPGTWSLFEAGVRAILGQQVSVQAAHKLVTRMILELGEQRDVSDLAATMRLKASDKLFWFPLPEQLANSDLAFFAMPGARKETLKNLARYYLDHTNPDVPEQWLALKGIGPWTVDYAKMRGLSDPDIYLGGDLGVKKAMSALTAPIVSSTASQAVKQQYDKDRNDNSQNDKDQAKLDPTAVAPWRSYLTLQLWSQL